MRKLDLILGVILLAISGIFYSMTSVIKPEGRMYPIFVIGLLAFLTVIHLIITLRSEKDEKNILDGIEMKQLLFVLIFSGIYVFLIDKVGYVISTFLYVLISLIKLKIEKVNSLLISIGFTVVIYILFKIVLKVPLPTGILI